MERRDTFNEFFHLEVLIADARMNIVLKYPHDKGHCSAQRAAGTGLEVDSCLRSVFQDLIFTFHPKRKNIQLIMALTRTQLC